MSADGIGCVIDASALLAMLHAEPGGDVVEAALEHGAISSVNWSEVYQRSIARHVEVADLRGDIEALGLKIVPFTVEDAEHSAQLWIATRHLGLSLGDRACLALARRLTVPVLTADRAWLDADLTVSVDVIR